jgi:hypothetical protein
MRRAIASVAVIALLLIASVPAAHAGTSTDVALGLASFAVFNQIVGALAGPREVHRTVVVTPPPPVVYAPPPAVVYTPPAPVVYAPPVAPPPVVYAPPRPVVYAPAPPPVYAPAPRRTVVHYPTGRYELHRRGHRSVWVWIPAPVILRPAH